MSAVSRPQRAYAAAAAVYLLIVAAVLVLVPGSVAVEHGADAGTWLRPAQGLVQLGAFVDPAMPETALAERPPLYPTLVAVTILLGGAQFATLLVAVQAAIFLLTAVLLARWTERLAGPDRPWAGPLAFALLLFNPNALGTVFFLQSETLFAALVLASAVRLYETVRTPSIRAGALTGLLLGLTALTRPEGQFLIPAAAVGLPVLAGLSGGRLAATRAVGAALVLVAVSAAATVPWMARNAALGEGFGITAASNTVYYLWGSNTQLEMLTHGIGGAEAEDRMQSAQQAIADSHGTAWEEMSELERQAYLRDGALDRMFDYPPPVLVKQVVLASLQFFTAGGAGRLFVLAGDPGAAPFAVMQASGESDYAAAVMSALRQADPALLALWAAAFGYVVATRLVGLVGLYRLGRSGRWELFLLVAGAILFFVFVMPFYGISRFRVPVEFAFVLLTVFALFPPRKDAPR